MPSVVRTTGVDRAYLRAFNIAWRAGWSSVTWHQGVNKGSALSTSNLNSTTAIFIHLIQLLHFITFFWYFLLFFTHTHYYYYNFFFVVLWPFLKAWFNFQSCFTTTLLYFKQIYSMVEWVFYTLLYRKNPLFNLLCLWNHTHILYLMLNRDTVLGFTTTLKFIPIFTRHITHSRNRSSYIKSPPI